MDDTYLDEEIRTEQDQSFDLCRFGCDDCGLMPRAPLDEVEEIGCTCQCHKQL